MNLRFVIPVTKYNKGQDAQLFMMTLMKKTPAQGQSNFLKDTKGTKIVLEIFFFN